MDFQTPLAKARGLGSAKTGISHWWMQRVTAVALVPLSFVLLKFLTLSFSAPYSETVHWLATPFNTVCIIAWVLAVFYHAAIGLQVVIEDYIASEGLKITVIWMVNLFFIFLGLAAFIAVLRIILVG